MKFIPFGDCVYGFCIPFIFIVNVVFVCIDVLNTIGNFILLFYIVDGVDNKYVELSNEYCIIIDDEFFVKYLLSLS